ncbi:MmcQ/YjbR family DNA-binding protein [Plantibacter sp. Mn2098]|uniref:MmcQ/YjbR family DNA-binding protein n=1 Tax=Plantibacter sp. Mn2098 TaxID=3395266 RepID=UPI003BC840F3
MPGATPGPSGIDIDELRAFCAGLPGAEERFPFQRSPELGVFSVFGTWFAVGDLSLAQPSITVKGDPDHARLLRETFAGITPGYHMNKRHWSSVILDGSVPVDVIFEIVEDAHALIVAKLPKMKRLTLGGV